MSTRERRKRKIAVVEEKYESGGDEATESEPEGQEDMETESEEYENETESEPESKATRRSTRKRKPIIIKAKSTNGRRNKKAKVEATKSKNSAAVSDSETETEDEHVIDEATDSDNDLDQNSEDTQDEDEDVIAKSHAGPSNIVLEDLKLKKVHGHTSSVEMGNYYLFSFVNRGYIHARWVSEEQVTAYVDATRRVNLYIKKYSDATGRLRPTYPYDTALGLGMVKELTKSDYDLTKNAINDHGLLEFSDLILSYLNVTMKKQLIFDGQGEHLFSPDTMTLQRIIAHRRIKRKTRAKTALLQLQNTIGYGLGVEITPDEKQSRHNSWGPTPDQDIDTKGYPTNIEYVKNIFINIHLFLMFVSLLCKIEKTNIHIYTPYTCISLSSLMSFMFSFYVFRFLVKWRGTEYNECSWELAEDLITMTALGKELLEKYFHTLDPYCKKIFFFFLLNILIHVLMII